MHTSRTDRYEVSIVKRSLEVKVPVDRVDVLCAAQIELELDEVRYVRTFPLHSSSGVTCKVMLNGGLTPTIVLVTYACTLLQS